MKRLVVFSVFILAFCLGVFAQDFPAITLDAGAGMFVYQGEKFEKVDISAGQYIWEIYARDLAEISMIKTDRGTVIVFKRKDGNFFQLSTWQIAMIRKINKQLTIVAG